MTKRPLLFFPSPGKADRTKRKPHISKLVTPSTERQRKRLSQSISELVINAELQYTSQGIDPEQTLVFETAGSVEEFINAVKKVEGLEWMGEIETEFDPDDDFYYTDNNNKKLDNKKVGGCFYLVMSNLVGMRKILSLFKKCDKDRSLDYGLGKFKKVFEQLRNIRKWGAKDRIKENLIEEWRCFLDPHNLPPSKARCEIEFWYRKNPKQRESDEAKVKQLVQYLGGDVVSRCDIPEIAYHSILVNLPPQSAQEILNQWEADSLEEVQLVLCESIMFIQCTSQISDGKHDTRDELSDYADSIGEEPSGNPIVALIDGLPLSNHYLLRNRLNIDSDDWEYDNSDRQHGTAMASLIVHGDLDERSIPLNKPVYVRPIMKPDLSSTSHNEVLPFDILLVDYIHRSVKRMIEGDGSGEAVAPTVKIINLSIGDESRPFLGEMSPFARLLDWLSEKYNILFIISSGNHSYSINLGITKEKLSSLSPLDLERLMIQKILEDARNRKILSPSESINGLTVGALHADNSGDPDILNSIDVFRSLLAPLPSPVSALGLGYGRSVKPDFLFSGGKIAYAFPYGSQNVTLNNMESGKIGNRVATPGLPGELEKTKRCSGSSNSAALVSHSACLCYEHLAEIFADRNNDRDFSRYGIPILKAMLVHGCEWNETGSRLTELLQPDNDSRQTKKKISRWIGYGVPNFEKVKSCNDQRATLIGFGDLKNGIAHTYELPLPQALNKEKCWRRLTVTLAWLSPVIPTSRKYRGVRLWFDFEGGERSRQKLNDKLQIKGIDCDPNITSRGTVQHEIFEGNSASFIPDNEHIQIKVNCREEAGEGGMPVRYGLIVSFEVSEDIGLPIYDQIQSKIGIRERA